MKNFPEQFLERFRSILPSEFLPAAENFFGEPRPITARVNTLKTSIGEISRILTDRKIECSPVPWCPEALIFPTTARKVLLESDLVQDGRLYIQALSSMLPVLALAPRPGEKILDMCAAPGGKTTQIAAAMRNQGELLCLEPIRGRYYKLKTVCELLGVAMAAFKMIDARRFRSGELFDRILLDVPCSCEGRFNAAEPGTYAYWSLRKIKEMRQKQRGIILNAGRLLKPGGVMVYATCTFSPEENEGVIDWFLRKTGDSFEIAPLEFKGVAAYPALSEWDGRRLDARVKNCLRILPTDTMEGFFIAKLVKK